MRKTGIVVITAKSPKLKEGKWFYKNPTIVKMDLSGKLIEKNIIETSSFSEFGFQKTSNDLKFIAGNKHITID